MAFRKSVIAPCSLWSPEQAKFRGIAGQTDSSRDVSHKIALGPVAQLCSTDAEDTDGCVSHVFWNVPSPIGLARTSVVANMSGDASHNIFFLGPSYDTSKKLCINVIGPVQTKCQSQVREGTCADGQGSCMANSVFLSCQQEMWQRWCFIIKP